MERKSSNTTRRDNSNADRVPFIASCKLGGRFLETDYSRIPPPFQKLQYLTIIASGLKKGENLVDIVEALESEFEGESVSDVGSRQVWPITAGQLAKMALQTHRARQGTPTPMPSLIIQPTSPKQVLSTQQSAAARCSSASHCDSVHGKAPWS